ncbi:hypothetical protein F0562_033723 [Nyssa sinensis]|uniref:Thioredoxin n=1 Tax=Nyssa sinensis TaxID=561372 RepID=A0A5J5AH69_9ASTE|nr:hypothetical protein F0562_033723 [Nyssa sinensis]
MATPPGSPSASLVLPCPTKERFQEILKDNNDKLVVVEFAASWCGYCKRIAPAVNEFAEKNKDVVVFVKVDWDEMKELTREYGVRGFPTFILLKKGKKVAKIVGAKKDELNKQIQKYKG